jgi:O-antigen ligase
VEISTAVIVAVIVLKWARMSKKAAYIVVAGAMGCALVGGAVVSVTGVERLWAIFNRGQDLSGLETASGRTGVWRDQIIYCISHPQGMGYIAGVRAFHRRDFATNLHAALTNIGGTDNSYMEVLTDAGWLALALYVFVLAKTFSLGWRFAKRPYRSHFLDSGRVLHHPLRCALFLFSFCLAEGMESSMYTIPMFECFYVQNILIAMILGASATMLVASRPAPDAIAR